MVPGTWISDGLARDSTVDLGIEDIPLAGTGHRVRWVAIRGDIEDWCIYIQNPHHGDA